MKSATITSLGIFSGEILDILEQHGPRPVPRKQLVAVLAEPDELVDMSLGYLLRQGLVAVVPCEGDYLVSKVAR